MLPLSSRVIVIDTGNTIVALGRNSGRLICAICLSKVLAVSYVVPSKSVVSNKNNNKVTHPNSFIELSEKSNHPKSFKLLNKKKDSNFRFLEGKRSMKSRKGSIGDQIKAGAHKGWENKYSNKYFYTHLQPHSFQCRRSRHSDRVKIGGIPDR